VRVPNLKVALPSGRKVFYPAPRSRNILIIDSGCKKNTFIKVSTILLQGVRLTPHL